MRRTFVMRLKPGASREEYRRRHDEIWPEMAALLSAHGVIEYTIELEEDEGLLLATQTFTDPERLAALNRDPVCLRWQRFMSDLLVMEGDFPECRELKQVFKLESER